MIKEYGRRRRQPDWKGQWRGVRWTDRAYSAPSQRGWRSYLEPNPNPSPNANPGPNT